MSDCEPAPEFLASTTEGYDMSNHDEPTVVLAPCSYHAPFLTQHTDGSPRSCGCGGLTVAAAAAELARLRAMERRARAVAASYSDNAGQAARHILGEQA